uniref:Ubiquitin-conjugating enzyme E2 Z n=1 Tax=uncultured marine group II/III euryarchaeote AD1000_88_G11 TaxID=1457822 RepID=A0A075G5E2_9EURY|nr:ubiquitin-conjugating enzyme E2 Z-like (UBE2Z) [uncultured marine group II/III euryarchaeote AD1000_88_G11]
MATNLTMSNAHQVNVVLDQKTPTISAQRRLLRDITNLIKNPLTDQGIYYIHDEDNILHGKALVIGPSDTLYSGGFFLFEFNFPYDYPYSPPKVLFKTAGDNIRFHPNLYRNGKVCLSLLNTWKGEGWTSCQTIRSILLTLVTLFHNKPLLNEPGISESYHDFKKYNEIIDYKNIDVAIYGIASQKLFPVGFFSFYTFIKKHFLENYETIQKKLQKTTEKKITVTIYNMRNIKIDYPKLKEKLDRLYQKLK